MLVGALKKMFKKAFWLPYEEGDVYPTAAKAREVISGYCKESGWTCRFTSDEEVIINGVPYEIYRGNQIGSRGNYGIKCRAK